MQSRLDRGEMPDQAGHDDVRVGYDKVLGRHDGFIDLNNRHDGGVLQRMAVSLCSVRFIGYICSKRTVVGIGR